MAKTKKLNALAKKWVAALRSGEYKQGRGRLVINDSGQQRFCCLGVLSDVAVKSKLVNPACFKQDAQYLSRKVQEAAGLSSNNGRYILRGRDHSLTLLNDVGKKSFKYIADRIESQPEGLFRD